MNDGPDLTITPRVFDEPRSLEERLTEYRNMLVDLSKQLTGVADTLDLVGANTENIRSGIHLQNTIVDDLTKIIDGEELPVFVVEGTLPS